MDIAERYTVFPIAYEPGTKTLTVATSDPTNVESLQELAFHSGQKLQVVVATASSIERAIRHHYHGEITSTAATPLSFGMEEATFELAPPQQLGSRPARRAPPPRRPWCATRSWRRRWRRSRSRWRTWSAWWRSRRA